MADVRGLEVSDDVIERAVQVALSTWHDPDYNDRRGVVREMKALAAAGLLRSEGTPPAPEATPYFERPVDFAIEPDPPMRRMVPEATALGEARQAVVEADPWGAPPDDTWAALNEEAHLMANATHPLTLANIAIRAYCWWWGKGDGAHDDLDRLGVAVMHGMPTGPVADRLAAVDAPAEADETRGEWCCNAGRTAAPEPCPWHPDGLRSDGHAPNCDGWHHPITSHCGDCGCLTCSGER